MPTYRVTTRFGSGSEKYIVGPITPKEMYLSASLMALAMGDDVEIEKMKNRRYNEDADEVVHVWAKPEKVVPYSPRDW